MEAITKRDRYRGAMVGVHAGDSLGAPYETWVAADILADFERRGGLTAFDYVDPWGKHPELCPEGRPTDDADHNAVLAESLIATRGFDPVDFYRRLKRTVFEHVSPLWDGKIPASGQTTRDSLRPATYEESQARPFDPTKEIASNGSVMRCVALALLYESRGTVDYGVVERMAAVTHRHPQAIEATRVCIRILRALLDGESREHARGIAWFHHRGDAEIRSILEDAPKMPRDPESWPGRGAAVLTLHVALWSLFTTDNFRDGITKAVSVGGDTDTYAAVAGGLLGAYYGIEGIPQDWQKVLIGRDKMIELADGLYDLAHPAK